MRSKRSATLFPEDHKASPFPSICLYSANLSFYFRNRIKMLDPELCKTFILLPRKGGGLCYHSSAASILSPKAMQLSIEMAKNATR